MAPTTTMTSTVVATTPEGEHVGVGGVEANKRVNFSRPESDSNSHSSGVVWPISPSTFFRVEFAIYGYYEKVE